MSVCKNTSMEARGGQWVSSSIPHCLLWGRVSLEPAVHSLLCRQPESPSDPPVSDSLSAGIQACRRWSTCYLGQHLNSGSPVCAMSILNCWSTLQSPKLLLITFNLKENTTHGEDGRSWVRGHTPVISTLSKLTQEDYKFKTRPDLFFRQGALKQLLK